MDGTLPMIAPGVIGHEGAGEVTEVGEGVSDLAVGDHVVLNFIAPCGTCQSCRRAGLSTPAATVAMFARRYMHVYGATSEDFGRVAVADRRQAASNPNA